MIPIDFSSPYVHKGNSRYLVTNVSAIEISKTSTSKGFGIGLICLGSLMGLCTASLVFTVMFGNQAVMYNSTVLIGPSIATIIAVAIVVYGLQMASQNSQLYKLKLRFTGGTLDSIILCESSDYSVIKNVGDNVAKLIEKFSTTQVQYNNFIEGDQYIISQAGVVGYNPTAQNINFTNNK